MPLYNFQDGSHPPVEVSFKGGEMHIDGKPLSPDLQKVEENSYHLLWEGKGYRIRVLQVDREEGRVLLDINGKQLTVTTDVAPSLNKGKGGKASASKGVKAPMPGLVVKVLVAPGQEVVKDTPLLVLEAMKMENIIKAAGPGKVSIIHVTEKQTVEKNSPLITFE